MYQSQENKPKGETTKLYTHNVDVDRINDDFFSKLKGTSKKFKATTKGNEKLREVLVKSVLAQEEIALKKGTKVKGIRLTDDPQEVDCKVNGSRIVLRTEFLKKK